MSLLVVGSIALDTVETPFGRAEDALGGSATFFAAAASCFCPVQVVGVIGDDFPVDSLTFLAERDVDLSGVESAPGESFRWSGVYSFDLATRETLETRLGVFANFAPRIPEEFRETEWVFLGNIDPALQLDVLDQISRPRFVACDTMNFWIESRRPDLLALLERVDLITLNDGEARQLTEESNLVKAARWIMKRGPRHVIIKKGEHGAFMFTEKSVFFAPAYPLEDVFDPTGAGDSFAGGFMGYLARTGRIDEETMRRAVVYGSAMGSFAVERFSTQRLMEISAPEIRERLVAFRRLVAYEEELPE